MIDVDNLSHWYGSRRTAAPVRDLSCTFADGRINYVVGLNGTGKSTLLGCLSGSLRPRGGRVLVDGRELRGTDYPLRHVGSYLSAEDFSPQHTGLRHLQWMCALAGAPVEKAEALVRAVGLEEASRRPIGGYSLGMRQRLGIASVLAGNPRNIVLDEPLNGLDIQGVWWLRELLAAWAEEGRCVIVASHHLREVEATTEVADASVTILSQGTALAHGSLEDVIASTGAPDLESAVAALIPELGARA
ncbi:MULTISPECIES: ATP-binding cassette domain-containing protein [Corynebacterium]|uniref:ATP-binding cassette domain-containing protein n=1 Tax=Corynebacterium aurimucosum TaxID=169292 RepID=A0A558ISQ1_9CORY|nr:MULTISPECIES: ATP-binding cassette domain-containing protein [Corynebacterium]HCD4227371.1 ATP-binding cassette domain-containing protein [Corynebacterium striatum]MTD92275.1 ATP-binding cassette domain-containing protein [Corynebacterium aurimucosum]OFK65600.1 hypothetical protein HMPREF2806_10950 [Corynebacterium sp. HMSC076G08]OFK67859.1 hypothetical protein HMPREF2807_05165 [Corynebacterium sp. HMSC074A09]OFN34871.1 hypothetical protein HMPREF2565_08460 [Corynebacterium sp. HMSC072A04]